MCATGLVCAALVPFTLPPWTPLTTPPQPNLNSPCTTSTTPHHHPASLVADPPPQHNPSGLDKILIERDEAGAIEYVKGIIRDLLMNKVDMSLLVVTKVCWCVMNV